MNFKLSSLLPICLAARLSNRPAAKLPSFFIRTLIILSLFAATFIALQYADDVKSTPISKPLNSFPKNLGPWTFAKNQTLSNKIELMLGVDDYIEYVYTTSNGGFADLFVSYFGAVGVTGGYHSPKNCMPGGGWNLISVESLQLHLSGSPGKSVFVNMATLQNGAQKQLMIYWFQNRGRIIASEYWEKIYLVLDAVFKHRRDGSFIRILSGQTDQDRLLNRTEMAQFAQQVLTALEEFLPGKTL